MGGFTGFWIRRGVLPGGVSMFGYLCSMLPCVELDLCWAIIQRMPSHSGRF